MVEFYRLEDSPSELPKHWSYSDGWELIDGEIVDNRQPGFQVWSDLSRVLAVVAEKSSADGSYPASEYPYFVIIEASNFYDSAGEWLAIRCEWVQAIKAVETQRLINWALNQWKKDLAAGFDAYEEDEEGFEGWCRDSEEEILGWLYENSTSAQPTFIETIENPYKSSQQAA